MSSPEQSSDLLPRRLTALVSRNARFGAAIRLVMAGGYTALTFLFAFRTTAHYLRPFAFLYLGLSAISAVVLLLVMRSPWVAARHFWLLPLLDIPVLTLERWSFLPHARSLSSAGLITLTYFLTFIALSLFSLDRRVVLATTAAGIAAGLFLMVKAQVVPVLIPVGMLTMSLAGIASYKALGHLRNLLDTEAAQARELRRLLAHLEAAREAERSRIAHELHDELGEQLSGLGFALALLRKRVQGGATAVTANLLELDGLLTKTRAAVRDIVTDLRPPALDELGLKEAVVWLVRRTETRAGLRIELEFVGDEARLESRYATAVFRILQESLTNIVRHAEAKSVQVAVRIAAELSLEIRDDGVGFERSGRTAGAGLVGMRERAAALGGEMILSTQRGQGTSIRVTLPLDPPAVTAHGATA